MTVQISKHEHITETERKKKMNNRPIKAKATRKRGRWMKGRRRVRLARKWKMMFGWPALARTNKRLCIDLVREVNEDERNNICVYFMISCVLIITYGVVVMRIKCPIYRPRRKYIHIIYWHQWWKHVAHLLDIALSEHWKQSRTKVICL